MCVVRRDVRQPYLRTPHHRITYAGSSLDPPHQLASIHSAATALGESVRGNFGVLYAALLGKAMYNRELAAADPPANRT